jgi:hypothetical protein
MSKESSDKDVVKDEIDLLELFRSMGRTILTGVKALGTGILISFVFLLKKWLPLGIALFISVGLSYILKKSQNPFYYSDMMIRSNTISNADMISYLNRLHYFCLEQNIEAVSQALSISLEKAKEINDIQAYWVIDRNNDGTPDYTDYKNKYNVYDTVNVRMPDRLAIKVNLTVPGDLAILKSGIFAYVNNNSQYRQKNEFRLVQINEMLIRLNYDIKQLDSLQKVKYFEETRSRQPEKNGQMIFLQEQKTQLIYEDIYTLYTRKQNLDLQKDLYPDLITIVSDFTIPVKPYNGLLYYGKVVVPVVMGLTIMFLIFLANRKKFKDFIKKY